MSSDVETCIYNTVLKIFKAVHVAGCIKKLNKYISPEAYLTVNINRKVRTSFTKFRLSSHKLLVERGRWTISKLDYKLRKCTLCNSGDIEDEYHVTLVCEQFAEARKKYLKKYFL